LFARNANSAYEHEVCSKLTIELSENIVNQTTPLLGIFLGSQLWTNEIALRNRFGHNKASPAASLLDVAGPAGAEALRFAER